MSLDARYPALSDLRCRAKRRIPHFMWEYLDAGTGAELGLARSRDALDRLLFWPGILNDPGPADLRVSLFGQEQALPFGIAPVGMSGAIWPGAEAMLARAAVAAGIPWCLSTMATRSPEDMAPLIGERGWYQLYLARDPAVQQDLLARVRAAGFRVLVMTVDTPVSSRRERQMRGGLTVPPRITLRTFLHALLRPAWSLALLRQGMPRLRSVERYMGGSGPLPLSASSGTLLRTAPDRAAFEELRRDWQGPLVVKGVMRGEDARWLKAAGADAVWVSNHAARQLDASPAPIDCVAPVRAAVGPGFPVFYDSGIEGGLDILRALAMGADFCFLGKAFHHAVAVLGEAGPAHLIGILEADIRANLGQMTVSDLAGLRAALVR